MMPTIAPAGTLKLRLSISTRSPKDLLTFLNSITSLPRRSATGMKISCVSLRFWYSIVGQLLEAGQARLALGLARLGVLAHPLQLLLHRLGVRVLGLLLLLQALLLLLQPGAVVALPRNAAAAVEFEDPLGRVVEEVAVVGDRRPRCPGSAAGTPPATRPIRRPGGWSARRAAACRAWTAAGGTARRGASRRPTARRSLASHGGRRSASAAISSWCSEFRRRRWR